jgi:hypothetical protein
MQRRRRGHASFFPASIAAVNGGEQFARIAIAARIGYHLRPR